MKRNLRRQWPLAAVLLLCGAPRAAAQAEQEWDVGPVARLVERTNVMPNSPALIKSLGDAAEYVLRWQPPSDAAGWRRRRPEVERAFRRAIGLEKLPPRTPLHARITARHDMGDYAIENLIFESRPGFPVTANVYRPKAPAKGKRAAVVCPIGHYLSAGKTNPDLQARCIKLARMGLVVLIYDAIGHGERMVPGNIHHEAGYALLPLGETVAGWMVWDSMRAIDYLLAQDDVDPARIGVTGNSGGGLNTLFTAAVDDRVRAAVVVGYTFEFNNWLKYAGAHCACTHLPGMFHAMEWFEIAGLIAPRALMMLQGSNDNIFPISGARRAGRKTETVYGLAGQAGRARFVEVPNQPHAYSRPYRERMYGWMARYLLNEGNGDPIPEGDVQPLPEKDPRLLCDPGGTAIARAPTVIDLARRQAAAAVAKLPGDHAAVAQWARAVVAPPEGHPHFLAPGRGQRAPVSGGSLEKLSFVSEDGEYIPGLLWLPERREAPAKSVVVVDGGGKAAVAKSGLVGPLLEAGFAVLAVDLRGRGETLGHYRPTWDTNFRLVANQVELGEPLAGRRAFDLTRAVDYLGQRREVTADSVTVVGLGDDALPALLAAAVDQRIGRVAVAGYFQSFVSQMIAMRSPANGQFANSWNDAQLDGRVKSEEYQVDFGSVIPSALERADVPDIAALIAPRKVLFCQARDNRTAAPETAARFRRVAAGDWLEFAPGDTLDARRLLEWLGKVKP